MKCSLVVNQLNDPFYIDYDEEFARYIIATSKEKGLLEEDVVITELDANLVMQLFSPLVLSQWLLIDQTKEPCSSVNCPNGFCFVFRHVDGFLFLAINGDRTESEEFLHRKIQIFIMLMKFLFGPVSEEIGQSQYTSKKAKWEFLRRLMKTWSEMVATEQAFLVEAIERLNVNQLVSEKCIEILERSVKQIQSAQDHPTQHAVLLVNSKLLALYSNRNAHELRPKDILSLMILCKTMYPRTDRLEDLFCKQYTSKKSNTDNDDNSDGGEDEYHSAPATPEYPTRSRSSSVNSDVGQNTHITIPQTERHQSVSDTDTIINSLTNLSSTMDSAIRNPNSTDRTCGSLVDMYREKYGNMDYIVDQGTETDGTETTQEIICTDHVIVADVHNEQGGYSSLDEGALSHNGALSDIEQTLVESVTKNVSLEQCASNQNSVSEVNQSQNDIETEGSCEKNPHQLAEESLFGEPIKNEGESTEEQPAQITNVPYEGKNTFSQGMYEIKTDLSEKSSDTVSLASSASNAKERSRTSTISSGQGDGSALEEGSVPSTRSATSSVVSNASKTYPELSLQTHPEGTPVEASLPPVKLRENRGNKRHSEYRNSRLSPRFNSSKARRIPSPTNTADSLVDFTIDTMQSYLNNSQGSGTYLPQTVFLETSTCQYSPHNVHTAQILPGVTLVLLSQAPRHVLADPLHQVMSNIQDLIYGRRIKLPRSRSLHVYDIINSLLGKLHNSLRKFKGRERTLISDIHLRWEKEDVKHRLLEYLERDSRYQIPPDVESPLMEMNKKLRELFSLLFLCPLPDNPQLWESISHLRVAINAELLDYREYLNVKSQRNITMTSYFEKYPGLIHFIFVDRRLHQMTVPSLNISLKEGETINTSAYLKENIWRMYQHMMEKLTEGYTTVMLREGDFYYSYFLWFEDSAGNPLAVQENFKPFDRPPYPGILSGSFYKDIIQQCFPQMLRNSVFCFEMFMMHVGSVHPQYIASHCKKLANELWEMSGDAYSTLSLF